MNLLVLHRMILLRLQILHRMNRLRLQIHLLLLLPRLSLEELTLPFPRPSIPLQ